MVDLPGTYSLTAYSLEEVLDRDFLINEKPDVVVDIVDASNLERNLYLAVQFLELGISLCLALNMIDIAENRGIKIDEKLFIWLRLFFFTNLSLLCYLFPDLVSSL